MLDGYINKYYPFNTKVWKVLNDINQPPFPKANFALLLLKLLYLRLYLSNHLGPSQATKYTTINYIWVEKYFKKSF